MRPTLWSLSFSPWSDQARWALDHCGVDYARRAYQPLLGEPGLRWKLRKWTGPVSVPILEADGGVLDDSFDIARYADAHAIEPSRRLFPDGSEAQIAEYDRLAQRALSAARKLGLQRVLQDESALGDLVPKNLKVLGPVAIKIAASGVRRTIRKYADVTPDDPRAAIVEALDRLREDLPAPNGKDKPRFVLGTFSYGDIVMAQALAFVSPPPSHLRLGEGSRRAYLIEDLAEEYADLVRWRDGLYAQRKPDRKR